MRSGGRISNVEVVQRSTGDAMLGKYDMKRSREVARSLDIAQRAESADQLPTLRQRARPIIDMLKRAHAEGKAVVRDV